MSEQYRFAVYETAGKTFEVDQHMREVRVRDNDTTENTSGASR